MPADPRAPHAPATVAVAAAVPRHTAAGGATAAATGTAAHAAAAAITGGELADRKCDPMLASTGVATAARPARPAVCGLTPAPCNLSPICSAIPPPISKCSAITESRLEKVPTHNERCEAIDPSWFEPKRQGENEYTRFLLGEKSRSRKGHHVGPGRFGELEFSILKRVFSVYYRFLKLRWSPAFVGRPAPYKHGVTTPYETRPMGEVVQSHRVRGVVCRAELVSSCTLAHLMEGGSAAHHQSPLYGHQWW